MRGDGNGWADGPDGLRRWGRHGAAGLLLRASTPDGPVVLLQHRAAWSHQGGTWALPGGARDSHESTVDAALREAVEETGLDPAVVAVRGEVVTSGVPGGWTYTTVVADAPAVLATAMNEESEALVWVPERDVAAHPLHPGFGAAWPDLRAVPARLVVDTANVLGARPDGWWRDRPGATGRLLERLAAAVPRTLALPGGGWARVERPTAVLEGAARSAPVPAGVEVVLATGSGDDELVAQVAPGGARDVGLTVLVTADRGLRERVPHVVALGPGVLLGWLDAVGDP